MYVRVWGGGSPFCTTVSFSGVTNQRLLGAINVIFESQVESTHLSLRFPTTWSLLILPPEICKPDDSQMCWGGRRRRRRHRLISSSHFVSFSCPVERRLGLGTSHNLPSFDSNKSPSTDCTAVCVCVCMCVCSDPIFVFRGAPPPPTRVLCLHLLPNLHTCFVSFSLCVSLLRSSRRETFLYISMWNQDIFKKESVFARF